MTCPLFGMSVLGGFTVFTKFSAKWKYWFNVFGRCPTLEAALAFAQWVLCPMQKVYFPQQNVNFIKRLMKPQKHLQRQPSWGVLLKSCSENMQQLYRRTSMRKCDFNKVAKAILLKSHECPPVHLQQQSMESRTP